MSSRVAYGSRQASRGDDAVATKESEKMMGTSDLETAYQSWMLAAQALDNAAEETAVTAARRCLNTSGKVGWAWLEASLKDPRRCGFAAEVVSALTLPRRLFEPFLMAAVHEKNPSANRFLIEPCVKAAGASRVLERLLVYLQSGSAAEKAGAASALYWVRTKEGECAELLRRIHGQMLDTFIAADDVDVRRRILPMLRLRESLHTPEAAKANEVIRIARSHSDDYLRHRVEVQLGNAATFSPLPDA